jgi:hypothetical protein
MTETELVGAYLEGQISRRTLIRRLVAAGVSFGAAVSYAQVLKPERAFARADADHYPDTTVAPVLEDLDRVVNRGRVLAKVHADEDSQLNPLVLRLYLHSHGTRIYIGEKQMQFTGPDTKRVAVPLTPTGIAILSDRSRAKIEVWWVGYDKQGKLPSGTSTAVFKP